MAGNKKERFIGFISKYEPPIVCFLLLVGAALMFINFNNPNFVPLILGILLSVIGLFKIVSLAIIIKNQNGFVLQRDTQGIAYLIAGILLLIFRTGMIRFLFSVIGIVVIVIGILKLLNGIFFKANFGDNRVILIVEGSFLIVLGFIALIINVETLNNFVTIFVGSVLIILSIINLVNWIKSNRKDGNNKAIFKNKKIKNSIDAEIINEKEDK